MTDIEPAIDAAARAHFAIQHARSGVDWDGAQEVDRASMRAFVTPLVEAAIAALAADLLAQEAKP